MREPLWNAVRDVPLLPWSPRAKTLIIGFDYVKVYFESSISWFLYTDAVHQIDTCDSRAFDGTNEERFRRWTDALTQVYSDTGKMLFYSLVEWQSFDAWTWGPSIAHSWRSPYLVFSDSYWGS